MTDRPIIFSHTMMICALIDGRKTQTRRLFKPGPAEERRYKKGEWKFQICDRLWVRETFTTSLIISINESFSDELKIYYRASESENDWVKWRSPIHMPRSASRLTLEVTDVKVERLQDISEEDAIAEGVEWINPPCSSAGLTPEDVHGLGCQLGFSELWNSIHGPSAWEDNPWVYAITFAVHKCNINSLRDDHGASVHIGIPGT